MCADCEIGPNTLYGVGLGPGDPELLTLKAVRLLKEADVILVPKGRKTAESVARNIVTRALGESLPFRELVFPMARDEETLRIHWAMAADETAAELDAGKTVVFVTLGDPSLYSTFSYLCRSLAEKGDYKVERVPGVSSVHTGAALLRRDLSLGDGSMAVTPLPENLDELDGLRKDHQTLVVMKIGGRLNEFREYLRSRNIEAETGFVRKAGFPEESVCFSVADLPAGEEGYLSLAYVPGGRG